MAETSQFLLPLLDAAQAQKHVTVNEALARLDAVTQLRLQARNVVTPPAAPNEGEVWGVGSGAVNGWAGQDGKLAIALGGGWVFVAPRTGWRAWVVDEACEIVFDGSDWLTGAVATDGNGAQTIHDIVAFDHVVAAGATNTTAAVIPSGAQVIGVTGRVLSAVTGTLASFDLGVAGGSNRYGAGLSLAQGSWIRGLSGSPLTYWSDTPLLLSAQGGDFASGTIRFAIHLVRLEPPRVA